MGLVRFFILFWLLKLKSNMKFQIEQNGRTFTVTPRTVKKSTPKSEVADAAKKCISMHLTTNYLTA